MKYFTTYLLVLASLWFTPGANATFCWDFLNFLNKDCSSVLAEWVCENVRPYCFECCQATIVSFGDSLTDSGEYSSPNSFEELLENAWGVDEVDWEDEYDNGYYKGSATNEPGTWSAQVGIYGHAKELNYAYVAAEVRQDSEILSIQDPAGFCVGSNQCIPTKGIPLDEDNCLDIAKGNCQVRYTDPEEVIAEPQQLIPGAIRQVQNFLNDYENDEVSIRNPGRAAIVIHSFGGNDPSVWLRRVSEGLETTTQEEFGQQVVGTIIQAVLLVKQNPKTQDFPVFVTGLLPLQYTPASLINAGFNQTNEDFIAAQLYVQGVNFGLQQAAQNGVPGLGLPPGLFNYIDTYTVFIDEVLGSPQFLYKGDNPFQPLSCVTGICKFFCAVLYFCT
mmetsp:Transcript_11536/g.13238  ORF Transcript_11536/g.13238 Transcript_11536/m.13238 type:complete len:389 (+) Transcript_11536:127-1293(+)